MDASGVLGVVGQVAGIGGVAFGVLLIIFRDVIRKNIFPDLAQIQAYRIIRLVIVLTFLIATAGIGAWAYVQTKERGIGLDVQFPTDNPEPVMLKHMGLIDKNLFSEAWPQMSQESHKRFQYDFVEKAYKTQRVPLGVVLQRSLRGVSTLKQLPDQTRGAFAIGTFISKFEKGGRFLEAVTVLAEEGRWKVLFHELAPCQPSICTIEES